MTRPSLLLSLVESSASLHRAAIAAREAGRFDLASDITKAGHAVAALIAQAGREPANNSKGINS